MASTTGQRVQEEFFGQLHLQVKRNPVNMVNELGDYATVRLNVRFNPNLCQQALKVEFARDFTEDLLNDLVDPSPLRRLARYLGMKDELSLSRFTSKLSHPANDVLKLRRGLHIDARTSNRYLLHERISLVEIEALSLPRARRLILRRAL